MGATPALTQSKKEAKEARQQKGSVRKKSGDENVYKLVRRESDKAHERETVRSRSLRDFSASS